MEKFVLNVKIDNIKRIEYPIIIGSDIVSDLNKYIKRYTQSKKILLVTNRTIYGLYSRVIELIKSKSEFDLFEVLMIEDGEEYKNFITYNKILEKLMEIKLERKDSIVAFGGGVVGDLVGFAAATYLRGINFIQVPTTLLAQVDSSVGGKTGINTEYGKNLIGSFYQPKFVLSDIDFLDTLNDREYKTGLSEVLKYAFIEYSANDRSDINLFNFLSKNREEISKKDKEKLSLLIKYCCELKSIVVNKDEKETGLREILNLGHTFAHGIEKLTAYREYTHGEAVAIGLKIAFNLANEKKIISNEDYKEAIELIKQYGIIPEIEKNKFKSEELIEAMYSDKKVKDNKIRYVIPISKSIVKIIDNIEKEFIKSTLNKYL